MVLAGGIEGTAEVVGLLRRSIIGMAEERLGNTDMGGIVDRQLRRNYFAEQMNVDRASQLALRDGADALADLFAGERLAGWLIQNASPATGAGEQRASSGR